MNLLAKHKKVIKLSLGAICVFGALFNKGRHPALPDSIVLPTDAHLSYSVRFFNPTMTGPALYYRIESSQMQRATATSLSDSLGMLSEGLHSHLGGETATHTNFPNVALRGSAREDVLVLPVHSQIFEADSETYGECRIWQRGKGSTAEILVWTNFNRSTFWKRTPSNSVTLALESNPLGYSHGVFPTTSFSN